MSKEITQISVDVLKVHPRNTEFFDDISGDDYEKFKTSIKNEGILSPVIVSPDMTIISGHQRTKAAKELGIKLIPIIIREDLIDEDVKLKALIAANFGRSKNNEAKQRKAITEYVELCGYKNGGNRKSDSHSGNVVFTLDEIATQLGTSKTNLTRALSIERKLTPNMKELLDTGVITKTVAADIISSLSPQEQEELISSMDTTKKLTQKEVQKYIDEINELKSNPPLPTDYNSTKKQLKDYKADYQNLQEQFQSKVTELQDLRKQIDAMKQTSPTEIYNQKLKDSTIFFCSKVADFIEKVGGYAWLTDHINELPEYEKKSFISAINAVNAWSNTILNNINI